MNVNEAESSRQIKRGAIISYLAIGFNILAGLLYTPWMIKQIGQENFGLYTLAISFISMFVIDFGLGIAVSRFISKYLAEGKQKSIDRLLGITYKIYLLIDVLILVALIIVYFNIGTIFQELTPNEIEKFKVIYIIAALFSVISFPFLTLNGVLTSYEKFTQLKLCDLFNRVLTVSLIVIALLSGFGLYALVTVNAISGLIVIILKLIIIKRKTPVKVDLKYYNKTMTKELFNFSAWSAIVGIAQRFIFNITPAILGSLSGSVNIAIFGIAASLEGYVFTIANAINGLFLPRVSRMVNKEEDASKSILTLMIRIGRIQYCIIGIIVVGFILLGKDFILLWVGDDYVLAYYSTILLILPSIVYLPQQIGNTAIVALNKVKLQAYVFILMSVINVVLSIIFSWFWGVIGASLAIFVSYSIRNIGVNFIYYRVLKIDVFKFFKECHIKLTLPLLAAFGFNFLILSFLSELSWFNFLFRGIVLLGTYIIIMWLFG